MLLTLTILPILTTTFAVTMTMAMASIIHIQRQDNGGDWLETQFGPHPTDGTSCGDVTVPDNTAAVSVSWGSEFCGKGAVLQNLLAEELNYVVAYTDNGLATDGGDPYFGIDDATYDALGWDRDSERTGFVVQP